MSADAVPELALRLDAARARVRGVAPRTYLTVLAVSVVGLAGTWVSELLHARDLAGVLAGVLLAVWTATALATLGVVVLLVGSALVSGALKVLALSVGGRAREKGSQGDVG